MRRAALVAATVLTLVGSASSASTGTSMPPARAGQILVVPAASATLPPTWRQVFVVRYGGRNNHLGTSPGGDAGTLEIGPEYGAPAPDGTWWFLDAAKLRLAHYNAAGRYLGQVRIPRRLLVGGRYFQWQLPHVMADGALVAARQDPDGTFLLRLRHGALDEIPVDDSFLPTYDDGRRLYGFAGRKLVSVNPRTGASKRVTSFRTPAGTPFTLSVGRRLEIGLPSGQLSISLRTASGARARVALQARAGADDSMHFYLVGAGADHPSRQLVGATSVSPSGAVAPVEALPNPFSDADPGSPAQLVIRPGSATPMLVYVLPDGVHVYSRT